MVRHLAAALVLAATPLVACSADDAAPDAGGTDPAATASPSPSPSATSSPRETTSGSPSAPGTAAAPRVVRTVATDLEAPWGLDFLPDGTAVVTERDSSRVLTIAPGGRVREVGVLEQADPEVEAGLLGVEVSPDFASDRTVYLYVSTPEDNRVVRARLRRGALDAVEPVLTGIPRGPIHDGGRIELGPDGYLYVSTGETGQPELAQDRDSLAGKILRITTEGEPAPGNPFPGSPVWSMGHRNVQGLAFDDRGRLWASEFGEDDFDELNLIRKGANYGWPVVEGRGGPERFVEPQRVWDTSEASPSGLAFLDGDLWMASLRGQRLWQVPVTAEGAGRPIDHFVGAYGRLRTVVVAPDDNLWVTTSNRDGRGDPAPADDRVLVVVP